MPTTHRVDLASPATGRRDRPGQSQLGKLLASAWPRAATTARAGYRPHHCYFYGVQPMWSNKANAGTGGCAMARGTGAAPARPRCRRALIMYSSVPMSMYGAASDCGACQVGREPVPVPGCYVAPRAALI